MKKNKIYLGTNEVKTEHAVVSGQFVTIGEEQFYQIENYQEMPDFFISIVSDSDHWMFLSSNGSLTAGRKNRSNALFPYYTEDKIHDYRGKTGSHTAFLVEKSGTTHLWEPFVEDTGKFYNISRNLYKSIYGNKIIFEEYNRTLGLRFRYGWYNSEAYGFVRKSTLSNLDTTGVNIRMLDGIKNILPPGIDYAFQNEYSNLLDAYKKSERVADSTLGLYLLSAIPVDRAEPSESLLANTVWSTGFEENSRILLSEKQVPRFLEGEQLSNEQDVRASRGAYLIHAEFDLNKKESKEWQLVAEVNQRLADVTNLKTELTETTGIQNRLWADIDRGTLNLKKMVASADGLQKTNTGMCYARHYTNTLFNIMRGGVFANNYTIDKSDFILYVQQINRPLAGRFEPWLEQLPETVSHSKLLEQALHTGDADMIRIANEYLPLVFSRRHGDPSRPWNIFSIETKNSDGSIKYNYEGNWRDIFQNWEALCYSFPEFTEGIISKFVNASTIDGYNPYRIMRNGIDWECPEPDDPWAYIGYWGDHQIIYLLKLLELSERFHPNKLDQMLTEELFTYANVPYTLKPYEAIVENPKDTVVFNFELNEKIKELSKSIGADARLLSNRDDGEIYKTNLTEKILATLLSKICNFIPEAGIWLNTQRPEWNDANNALVGNGTSMVTLYYLYRFLKFWESKFAHLENETIHISDEVARLFERTFDFLKQHTGLLNKGFSDADRKVFADALGKMHSDYRTNLYENLFSGKRKELQTKDLLEFTRLALKYFEQTIRVNRRTDGLYHAYNLIAFTDAGVTVRHLYEMLEGQVAVLSSGYLSVQENLSVLEALKSSKIYRPDQYSYMLYPDRELPRFMEKNTISPDRIKASTLLTKLIEDKDESLVNQDTLGDVHFNEHFRNADVLNSALDRLATGLYGKLVEEERERILAIYEEIFDHQSFTGRSGTFYGYEGLGSIYWHMVSKLLLATQECFFQALDTGADAGVLGKLKSHYYEIKAGIGLYKSPDVYGAFPTDAYSHTPGGAGVKQPGLTGQVKEDIISRIGEMGVKIEEGKIFFETNLLNTEEILVDEQIFEYYSLSGEHTKISLNKDQLAFTICQVPVIYTFSDEEKIAVSFEDGSSKEISGNSLDAKLCSLIFSRSGQIKQVEVSIITNE